MLCHAPSPLPRQMHGPPAQGFCGEPIAADLENAIDRFSFSHTTAIRRDISRRSIAATALLSGFALICDRPAAGSVLQRASRNQLANAATDLLRLTILSFEHKRKETTSG